MLILLLNQAVPGVDALILDAADSLAASGLLRLQAATAIGEAADVLASVGQLRLKAAFAVFESGDILAAAGAAPLAAIGASLASTEAGDSLGAVGSFLWAPTALVVQAWTRAPTDDTTWIRIAGAPTS